MTDPERFAAVDAGGPLAVAAVTSYLAELGERFGFAADDAAAALADTAHAYNPPQGQFVAASDDDGVLAAAALSWLDADTAEVKRMWVSPRARGRGLARALLTDLERRAAAAGRRRIVLDTNEELVEAIALYRRCGYTEIEAYNDNPYAHCWFAKDLDANDSGNA